MYMEGPYKNRNTNVCVRNRERERKWRGEAAIKQIVYGDYWTSTQAVC